jgi:cephalosporin-C deacetylase-like acetyl esterase
MTFPTSSAASDTSAVSDTSATSATSATPTDTDTTFPAYWNAVDEELAETPARPVLTADPARSTEFSDFYTVGLTGLGGYRVFGYLSVPHGPGPFPALLETPRHGSVNHSPHYNERLRYLVFTVMHRGQRLADRPFAAAYPGLFTLGIEDPATYVYREVVADCLRGADFLLGQSRADPARTAVIGDDLALITAARRPFSTLCLTSPLFHRALEARESTSAYPLEELNDLLRAEPGALEAVRRTLAFFDPVRHAPSVSAARTLLAVDGDAEDAETAETAETAEDTGWYAPLLAALGRVDLHRLTHEDAADHNRLDAWLAARLGTVAMTRFRHEVSHEVSHEAPV